MPGVLYRILSGAMPAIRTNGDFYLFHDFHMVEFMSTLNIANSHTQH